MVVVGWEERLGFRRAQHSEMAVICQQGFAGFCFWVYWIHYERMNEDGSVVWVIVELLVELDQTTMIFFGIFLCSYTLQHLSLIF